MTNFSQSPQWSSNGPKTKISTECSDRKRGVLQWSLLFCVFSLLLLSLFSNKSYGAAHGTLNLGTLPASATLCPGATNQPIYSFTVKGTGGGVTISNLTGIKITGFVAGDVTKFKLYWNDSDVFTTAEAIVCSLATPNPGTMTFTPVTAKGTGNATIYFWITADIAGSPTNGSTIRVDTVTSSNVPSATSGTSTPGNTFTIHTAPASITGVPLVCVGATTTLGNSVTGGSWSSSATTIATVGSATGIVSGVATGTATITYATGCGTNATKVVTVGPPAVFSVSGGGSYCSGGVGLAVGLSGSQSNVNYQLYNGSSIVGSPVAGTGSSFSFGTFTASGTYTVRATNPNGSCTSSMTSSATININPLPTARTVTGGGHFCAGGTGVSVGLDGSDAGINYQLYNGSTAVGSAVGGTGSAFSFGTFTAAGTYSVRATNTTTSCSAGMAGSAIVSIDPLPDPHAVTGGGHYCAGGAGVSVGIDGSDAGINYQLYNGSSTVGSAVGGTGSAFSFGTFTAAGTYSVRATNATTSCSAGMGSVIVSIDPLPDPHAVTGGGHYCAGGAGVSVGIDGSDAGINYQLYNGSTAVGSAVGGTGAAFSFGNFTAAGTYSVRATNATTSCSAGMGGSVIVSIDPLPDPHAVTGGGHYCAGGAGVSVGIDGSDAGINYQLYNGSTAVGSAVGGTGSAFSFGTFTAAGTYSVRATNATTSCSADMGGSAIVSIDPLPDPHSVTGGGNYCAGGAGVSVGLDGSDVGINYQLYNGSSTVGSAVGGTGAAFSFGTFTAAGTYSVRATNATTSCTAVMDGSATIGIDPLPDPHSVTGGGNYCAGGSGVSVGLDGSDAGINYQLYNGSTAVGSAVGGTGAAFSFGTFTAAGTYSVRATNATTSCTAGMDGSASIGVDPLPDPHSVTGGGNYCAGGAGMSVGLDGSDAGINYQLYNGSTAVGSAVGGTGAAFSFGTFTAAGTYSVRATNATTSCTAVMDGSATIGIDPLPDTHSVTGGGNYCAGGTGVSVGLDGSDAGINYQLYNGSTAVGSAVGGTGAAFSFGTFTAAGTYSVRATNATTSCTAVMDGSVAIGIDPAPAAIGGIAAVCVGSIITLTNTVAGGTWSSADATIASVGASTGVVTGMAEGNVTITYATGASCYATKEVTVNSSLEISGLSTVCVGLSTTLAGGGSGLWTTDNPSVATVGSPSGCVTGMAAGTATISNTSTTGGCSATFLVTVTSAADAGTLSTSTGAFKLRMISIPTLTMLSSGEPGGTWTSSNPTAATIDPVTGVATAVHPGHTVISYTVSDGGCTSTASHFLNVSASKDGNNVYVPEGFTIYPNPTSGTFTLTTGEAGTMTVYTVEGKELYHFDVISGISEHSIEAGLSAGIYICRFSGTDGSTVMVRLVYEP